MKILVFRTDIKTKKKVRKVKKVLDNSPKIKNWNVDLEDIDNVLRVEVLETVKEKEIQTVLNFVGYHCLPLE